MKALLALALIGCISGPCPVTLDCPQTAQECEAAAEIWAKAGAPVRVAQGGANPVRLVTGPLKPCGGKAVWIGCERSGVIEVVASVPPGKARTNVLMHEIGHALGLDHLPTGIMYHSVGDWDCIDEVTASLLVGVHATCQMP